jgi:hypothetical protein
LAKGARLIPDFRFQISDSKFKIQAVCSEIWNGKSGIDLIGRWYEMLVVLRLYSIGAEVCMGK